jgi:tetratricopeptide (TPR) repeat protein
VFHLKLTSMVLASVLWVPATEPAPEAEATVEAEAPDPLAEAKQEYREGSAAYQTGRYEEAVTHFERSFELSHRSDLLYNLGQAYSRWYEVSDKPEHLRRARRLFKNYIVAVEDRDDMSESREDARRRIGEIDQQLEKIEANEANDDVPPAKPADKPLYKKGWFWGTIVGVIVVAAAATTAGVLISRRRQDRFEPELGTLGELRPSAPGGGFAFRF